MVHMLNSLSHSPYFKRPLGKKPFENIVEKGEYAGKQHFLLFPQCFPSFSKQISDFGLNLFCLLQMLSIWTSLKLSFGNGLTLYHTMPHFDAVHITCEKKKLLVTRNFSFFFQNVFHNYTLTRTSKRPLLFLL